MVTPDGYLGADLSQMYNEVGDYCWAMSSDKYCQALVTTVAEVLQKKGLRLPTKCYIPMRRDYRPELDCTSELKSDAVQWYQALIGSMRWAIELGKIDILFETSIFIATSCFTTGRPSRTSFTHIGTFEISQKDENFI